MNLFMKSTLIIDPSRTLETRKTSTGDHPSNDLSITRGVTINYDFLHTVSGVIGRCNSFGRWCSALMLGVMNEKGEHHQPRELSAVRIRLSADQPAPRPDPLGRARIGWAEGLDLHGLWERGRGVWKADLATIAEADLVVLVAENLVRLVGSIDGVTFHGDRVAIGGRPLVGHPLVGELDPIPNSSADPLAYGTVTTLSAAAFPAKPPSYSQLLATTIGLLTTAVRRRRPVLRQDDHGRWESDPDRSERGDWAQFLTVAMAGAAANNGGIEAALATSRPGSWEADSVRQILHATVGHDEEGLWAYRTEPVEITLCVDELLTHVAHDTATAYAAATNELRRRHEAGLATVDHENQLEALRLAELHDWGEALRARILQLATEMPGLAVPVRVEIDTTTTTTSYRFDRDAIEYSLQDQLITQALNTTPTPADLPGTPLNRLDQLHPY